MKLSYARILHFLPVALPLDEMVTILTAIGLEVDGVSPYHLVPGGLAGVVVGEVLSCSPHPNADRLRVTTVDVGGGEPLPIVCGAPNVAMGQKVAVATVGAELHPTGGEVVRIKKSKLRGEASHGMICAEDELGLGTDHDGIMVLDPDLPVGQPLAQALHLEGDHTIEIGLTANRADAMSHFGVARDLAAYLNLKAPTRAQIPAFTTHSPEPGNGIRLGSMDRRGVIRYCGATLRGVRVGPSPDWVQHTLRAIGLEPINCVVDITNLVLHDLGTPLHAFDLRAFTHGEVSVRCGLSGQELVTLDGRSHTLRDEDLLICDGDTPLCLAGVFGGQASGVKPETTDIFLEAAVFQPTAIRKTARAHGLNTDASFRFERGVDPTSTLFALNYAVDLLLSVAGGQLIGEILDFYPEPVHPHEMRFDPQRANELIGVEIPPELRARLFEGLEIEQQALEGGELRLRVPYYRIDVTRPCDVVEEMLRIYGFDRIPVPERLTFALPNDRDDFEPRLRARISEQLVGLGYFEQQSLSLMPQSVLEGVEAFPPAELVPILNPQSADLNVLRPTLLWGTLETVARNVARQRPDLALFEFGHVFGREPSPQAGGEPLDSYRESGRLALALAGNARAESWHGAPVPADFFTLKGHVLALLQAMGVNPEQIFHAEPPAGLYVEGISLRLGEREIAHLGTVSDVLIRRAGLKVPVQFAELNYEQLVRLGRKAKHRFTPLPRFPEVRRDLALLIDAAVRFEDLRRTALATERKLLQRVDLFDVYEGESLPDGKKSYALSFILQDASGTLNDVSIERVMQRLIEAFKQEHGAELR